MATGQSGQLGLPVVHLVVLDLNYVIEHVTILFLLMVACHVLVTLKNMWIVLCQLFARVCIAICLGAHLFDNRIFGF